MLKRIKHKKRLMVSHRLANFLPPKTVESSLPLESGLLVADVVAGLKKQLTGRIEQRLVSMRRERMSKTTSVSFRGFF